MNTQDTTLPPLLVALKEKISEAIKVSDDVGRSRGSNCYAHNTRAVVKICELQDGIERDLAAIAAQAPQPLAPAPSTFDLTEARAIVVGAIRRMRAAHVGCLDLTMKAEGFLEATHAAAKSDQLWTQTLEERDRYHEVADKLAQAIAKHLGIDIGEHSSANCPWDRALEALDDGASVRAQQAQGVPASLQLGVAATKDGATVCLIQPHADGSMTVIHSGTHPIGDTGATVQLAAAPQAEPQPEREPIDCPRCGHHFSEELTQRIDGIGTKGGDK